MYENIVGNAAAAVFGVPAYFDVWVAAYARYGVRSNEYAVANALSVLLARSGR
jgi:hypothetical protein